MSEPGKECNFPRPLADDEVFYRALHPEWLSGDKISSAAFANPTKPVRTDGLSVDWAEKSTPEETFDRWKHWGDGRGVASITANLCWDNFQQIVYTPDEVNPSHSDVVGRKSERIRKNLAKCARLVKRS